MRLLAGAQVITEGRFCKLTKIHENQLILHSVGLKYLLPVQSAQSASFWPKKTTQDPCGPSWVILVLCHHHSTFTKTSTYLLSLNCPTHDRPLSARDSVLAAFGQSQRLVYSISRNGSIQVVAMDSIGGGSNLLHRGVTMPPVFIMVFSSRRTSP